MDAKFHSRKYQVTLMCIGIGTVMAFVGKLTGELSALLTVALGAYNAANAWVHKKDG
jgi:hypothetical protein